MIRFGWKVYHYKKSSFKAYYLTINDVQVGGVMFSQGEVETCIEKVKAGQRWSGLSSEQPSSCSDQEPSSTSSESTGSPST